eukprot:1160291-Pelagomonas_calceolata.AAC.7
MLQWGGYCTNGVPACQSLGLHPYGGSCPSCRPAAHKAGTRRSSCAPVAQQREAIKALALAPADIHIERSCRVSEHLLLSTSTRTYNEEYAHVMSCHGAPFEPHDLCEVFIDLLQRHQQLRHWAGVGRRLALWACKHKRRQQKGRVA